MTGREKGSFLNSGDVAPIQYGSCAALTMSSRFARMSHVGMMGVRWTAEPNLR